MYLSHKISLTLIATDGSSVRPLSPVTGAPAGSCDDVSASQLPTPALTHPYTWSTAQIIALESRVNQLETPNLAARLTQIEAALTDVSILKASVAQLPALQDEINHLETVQQNLATEVARWATSLAELKDRAVSLEVRVKGLVGENDALKGSVAKLEARLHGHDNAAKDTPISGVIVHSPRVKGQGETVKDMEKGKAVEKEATVGAGLGIVYVIISACRQALLTSYFKCQTYCHVPGPQSPQPFAFTTHPWQAGSQPY